MRSNVVWVSHLLLNALSVKHSLNGLKEKLEHHPNYPSLIAVTDCIDEWQVENEVFKVAKEDYRKIELPFIAHLNANGGRLILVKSLVEGNIYFSDETHRNGVMAEEQFLHQWDGIVLRAESKEGSGEPEYNQNRWKDLYNLAEKPIIMLSLTLLILLAVNFAGWNLIPAYYVHLFISLAGAAVTILLLIATIGSNNPLIENLCSFGSKNGCNAILKTRASKLTNWLSWSEVGFFYFIGCSLTLIFASSSLPIIAWLNLLTLPYAIYSISFQYRMKNWCILCCSVQFLLATGAINVLIFDLWSFRFSNLAGNILRTTPVCFLFPILFWYLLKPFFERAVGFGILKEQLKKFKYNSEIFNQILKNQTHYIVEDSMPFVLGNTNPRTVITMVSNPFCNPCAKAHKTVEQLLKYREDIQLKIIFTTANDDYDESTKFSRHISALSISGDTGLMEKALNEWYGLKVKSYDDWAARYPLIIDIKSKRISADQVTKRQQEWCLSADIAFTPTILINGFKMPEPYKLDDMKYLLA